MEPPSSAQDLYRDTPIRYLGYANEVGESFRLFIGAKWVAVTYGIATLYVLADTSDKTLSIYKCYKGASDCHKRTAYTALDTLLWQMLASVIIPGFAINRICAGSNFLLKQVKVLPRSNRMVAVTGLGLLVIPFIIKPIDRFVDEALDTTIRQWAP